MSPKPFPAFYALSGVLIEVETSRIVTFTSLDERLKGRKGQPELPDGSIRDKVIKVIDIHYGQTNHHSTSSGHDYSDQGGLGKATASLNIEGFPCRGALMQTSMWGVLPVRIVTTSNCLLYLPDASTPFTHNEQFSRNSLKLSGSMSSITFVSPFCPLGVSSRCRCPASGSPLDGCLRH